MNSKMKKQKIFEMVKMGKISPEEALKLLKSPARLTETEVTEVDDIAVIGVAGRYPQADDISQFWNNLSSGVDSITEIPRERWDWRDYYNQDPAKAKDGKMYNKWGGFINDVDRFDPLFFSISPIEAETIDPQERLLLQTVWHTLEDANYTRKRVKELTQKCDTMTDVGVFIGETTNNYLLWGPEVWNKGHKTIPNTFPWSIANRVSYFFDWTGPSMAIDTACSSSLAAIHMACESLKRGECAMAIAGGVNLYLHPIKYVWLCQMTMLSKKGRCHTFGVDADGFEPGEGIGSMLLKPLKKAIKDGDKIYAVIKGSSVNHDGKTTGYTVPNPNAQSSLIRQALKNASIDPRTISYIEAHGTGTALGDPIEITGLTNAFREYTKESQFCSIGSSKSNIGHLESAAGIAGLTKIILQMQHKKLVPSLHSSQVNPQIDFASSPFYIQQELEDWEKPVINGIKYPRRAGISSFGAGGVNSHIIVEEYEQESTSSNIPQVNSGKELIIISAKSREALNNSLNRLANYLGDSKTEPNLADLAYTLQFAREEMEERAAIVCGSIKELIEKLQSSSSSNTFFYANSKKFRKELSKIRPDKSSLEKLINARELERLAELWTKGVNIDWTLLWQNKRKFIELPPYPFDKERCWIPEVKPSTGEMHSQAAAGGALHPLLGQNSSTLEEQSYTTMLSGNEFFLSDHIVSGDMVLPGVAYVEMARAAAELAGKKRVSRIKGIVWTRPIIVNSAGKEVTIGLYPTADGVEYEVYSKNSSEPVVHGQGKVVFEEQSSSSSPNNIDPEAIKNACSQTMTVTQCYDFFSRTGLDYGVGFRGITELYYNKNEVLSKLVIPDSLKAGASSLALHPTLMDGALQSMVGLIEQEIGNSDTPYLPYTIGEVAIYDKMPAECYAYVTRSGKQSEQVKKFNLLVTDGRGKVVVEIKDFVVRAYTKGAAPKVQVESVSAEDDKNVMALLGKLQSGTLDFDDTDLLVEEIYG